jgi:hypothetical protein
VRDIVYWVTEGLAFLLELGAVAALGYWGFTTGQTIRTKILFGVGAPVLAGILWGLFAAPQATFGVPVVGVLAVKALVFGTATIALHATRPPRTLTLAFAILAVTDTIAVTVFRAFPDA